MLLTENLVQGVDLWVNTPRRPWEACGTSGMKVLVNGGINLSELDGWWAEAYSPELGWALGDGQEQGDDPAWDAREAEALFDLLETEVIPEFYDRNQNGIPTSWIERMRKSMATLTPRFSANRAVREYTEQFYLPAVAKYKERAAENGKGGLRIVNNQHELRNKWEKIQFGNIQTQNVENGYLFQVHVMLNGINPNLVSIELYAEGINGGAPMKIKMQRDSINGDDRVCFFHTMVTSQRPVSDYTARIIPCYENISVPLEDKLIFWQR
jgi:glycogen phosphorylase